MERIRLEKSSFLVLFAASAVLAFLVFQPFINIILLAAVFAVLLTPLYERILRAFGGGAGMASFTVVFGVLIFLVVPLFFLGGQIFNEARGLYFSIQGGGADYARTVENAIEASVRQVSPDFSFDARAYAGRALGFIADNLAAFVGEMAFLLLATLLFLMTLYFFLRDGRALLDSLISLSPLERKYDDEILGKIHKTISSAVKGTMIIALVQGAFVAMGFFMFNVPNAVLWGSVGAISSLVPGIGTGIVMIPAALYLLFEGSVIAVVGFALWSLLIVGLVDNFLIPYFFGKDSDLLPIFVLLSVLGGIAFFGPLGFIFGPIILSLFISMLHIYRMLLLGGREGENGMRPALERATSS